METCTCNFPCQSCDRASITSARGSVTGDINLGRRVLRTVANMSTNAVTDYWSSEYQIHDFAGWWRLHSVVMGWFG